MRSPSGAGLLSCNRNLVGIVVLLAGLLLTITGTSALEAAQCVVSIPEDYPTVQKAVEETDCFIRFIQPRCTVTVPGDYPSIQDAVDHSACDILLIEPEYQESVVIDRDVQISGTGSGITHVIGDPAGGSVFTIAEGETSGWEVTLKDMTIRGGRAPKGGGINNNGGALSVERCAITANHATAPDGTGGGIYNHKRGVLLLVDSRVSGNSAVLSGAGVSNSGIDTTFLVDAGDKIRNGVEGFYNLLEKLKDIDIPSIDLNFLLPGSLEEYIEDLSNLPSHLDNPVSLLVDLAPEEILGAFFNNLYNLAKLGGPLGGEKLEPSALIVINSIITGNVTGSETSVVGARGGGIHNDLGAVVITGSTISNNAVSALVGGFGGGLDNAMGIVIVDDTVLEGNSVTVKRVLGGGGAVFNLCGVLVVENSDLTANESDALNMSNGGGIFNMAGGSAMVYRSTIADNLAGNGGGIANLYRSKLTIEDSTIRDNSVSGIIGADGGGIMNGEGSIAAITRSTVSGNQAVGRARVGGIFNLANEKKLFDSKLYDTSKVSVKNSTISNNAVIGRNILGSFPIGAYGGGIYNGVKDTWATASVTISSSTITGNRAEGFARNCHLISPWCIGGAVGGGLYNTDHPDIIHLVGSIGSVSMSVRNSLVVGNTTRVARGDTVKESPSDCDQPDQGYSRTFRGEGNLESNNTCIAYSSPQHDGQQSPAFVTPPSPVLLGPLENNGGPTLTHGLMSGSPGVDQAAGCPSPPPSPPPPEPPPPPTDQRGVIRPDAKCDIGAFEVSKPVGVADDYKLLEDQPLDVSSEQGVMSNDLVIPGSTVVVQTPPAHGTLTLDPDGAFVYTPAVGFFGLDSFTYILEDNQNLTSNPTAVTLRVVPLLDVVAFLPGAGAVDVAADADIVITFDTPIDPATVDANILLSSDQRGPIGFTSSQNGSMLTLDPLENFRPGEQITMLLTDGLRGSDRSAPSGPLVFQFVATAPQGGATFIHTDMLGDDRSRQVALGDLNGDGVLDAFIATEYGNSRVWLGVGNGEFTESSHRPPTLGMTGVALGDLDGDGDLDAFLVNGFAKHLGKYFDVSGNTVWLNNGYGRFQDSGQRLGNGVGERVALGDVDGDGDLDAFVANYGSNTGYVSPNDEQARDRLWMNDGSGHFSRSNQNLGAWDSAAVDLGDLDGDSDLDAVVAVTRDWYRDDDEWHFRPSDRVWLNDGAGRFSGSGQLLDSRHSTDVSLADLDGDGDIDAFVANDAALVPEHAGRRGESVWLNQNTPLVQDDTYTGQEDQPLVVFGPGLLANDMDPDGDPISASLTRLPQHGTLAMFNPDGSFTYAPNPDFYGTDTFSYRIADGYLKSAGATVTLQISAANDAPKAIDGFYDLVPGLPLSVSAPSGILNNGSDIDGDPLNVFLNQSPKGGELTLNPDGSFTYTPDPETVADAFTCHISDGLLDSDIIRIKLGNTVPVANGDLLYSFTPGTRW